MAERKRGNIQSAERLSSDLLLDRGSCVACGACAKVCCTGILEIKDSQLALVADAQFNCFTCGQCMAVCPAEAIFMTGYDYSGVVDVAHEQDDPDRLNAIFAARRSVRNFSPEPVPEETVRRIIESASSAPMALPPQKLSVTAIMGREKVAEIAETCMVEYERFGEKFKKPIFRMIMRLMASRKDYKMIREFVVAFLVPALMEAKKRGIDGITYGGPVLLLIHGDPNDFCVESDSQILATYLQLAATAEGLGSIILGDVPPLFTLFRPQSKERYGVPKNDTVYLAVVIGRSKTKYLRAAPRRLKSVRFT